MFFVFGTTNHESYCRSLIESSRQAATQSEKGWLRPLRATAIPCLKKESRAMPGFLLEAFDTAPSCAQAEAPPEAEAHEAKAQPEP